MLNIPYFQHIDEFYVSFVQYAEKNLKMTETGFRSNANLSDSSKPDFI